jgi:predicted PurR-regulated permease PerM
MQIPPVTIHFSARLKWFAVLLVCVFAYVLYTVVHDVAMVFFGAIITAYIFYPVVTWLTRYLRGSRMGATAILFGVVALILIIAIQNFATRIVLQYELLRHDLPQIMAQLEAQPLVVAGVTVDVMGEFKKVVASVLATLPTSGPHAFVGIIEGFLHTLAFLITTFYLLLHGRRMIHLIAQLVPDIHRDEVRFVMLQIHSILSGYIRGTLLLIPIMAVFTTLALWILGVHYPLLIGIVSGVVEILPIVGPWSAAAFAVLMAVFQSPMPISDSIPIVAGTVGGLYLGLRMFEDYVIIPAVVGPAVHLHPILVIAAILAGAAVGGALGLFLAIPVTSVLQYLLRWLYAKLMDDANLPAAQPSKH